ncbi:MAG: coenzyme F420-0:L-glutamate ligase [Proteobacteria bacterium]|nr:coenzyme F420-0:L-glutamate ligase [Pseudomonadota bacterium]
MPSAAPRSLTLTALESLPLVQRGDDLAALLADALQREGLGLTAADVVVVAQKIVSKAEGRTVDLATIKASRRAVVLAARTRKDARLVQLILNESKQVLRVGREVIIVEHRNGFILANAGIDQSNVGPDDPDNHALLLPANCDLSARRLRAGLRSRCGVAPGVLIIDSIGRAWRRGTIGQALGAAGLTALADLRGDPDLFGRALRSTEVGSIDELAAAASILMGQAGERRPAVIVRGFPVLAANGAGAVTLQRPEDEDMFR